ncbi:esterase-like activity of phytase family protein [Actinoalloteichus hymeniacidonis]|uniref:Phytase-like domain-containing protein n=1 Tax=Actinoalloteichus hymeniacidonis TaxID=340345 RepID=A0AAC9HMX4_9PSEU|nr:esterase-like activity of phytase family protein [Actinoalloteichus hymeniacidonis]AOS62103.1 hypothetical protein TL08_06390 [Actinoalloteichus hymeniacidonis]MBB5909875.1 hypothetical protein [Actinoalloteichus hymeniacidonis]
MRSRLFATALAALTAAAGLLVPPAALAQEPTVRLLGEHTIAHRAVFEDTIVGGLSSIDRDPHTGDYALLSDDWSDHSPARYYRAEIDLDAEGLHDVELTDVHLLRRPDGRTYPTIDQWRIEQHQHPEAERNVLGTVDPEELRIDPWTGDVAWTSEGQRNQPGGAASDDPITVLMDPAIRVSDAQGAYQQEVPTATNEKMTFGESGPRVDDTLEGLTYAAGGTLLVSALESPLEQDGPVPTTEHGAHTRITVHARHGAAVAQFAYPVDPVFAESPDPDGRGSNGVSSLVAYDTFDPSRYLVVERGYVVGVGSSVRVFEVSTAEATDVLSRHSLVGGGFEPASKRLLVDLADIGAKLDNIEGITWGPPLPTGERTLLLVSDDNFSAAQTTRITALAVG